MTYPPERESKLLSSALDYATAKEYFAQNNSPREFELLLQNW
jgi:hypothetical protein